MVEALKMAKEKGLITIGSSGKNGGQMVSLCQELLVVPDDNTARIQEIHMLAAHSICEFIDNLDWDK